MVILVLAVSLMNRHTTPFIAILVILLSGVGDYAIVLEQYCARWDGVVIARTDDLHYPPWTRIRVTKYVVRGLDGSESTYHSDPSIGARDGFPPGIVLKKRRWTFAYEEDGKARNDFPFPFYFLLMVLDAGLLIAAVMVAILIRNRDRTARELAAAFERGQRLLEREG
jgi:hypothetical protein